MMAQNDPVVVGIDVAKDKVDACVRSLSLRLTCPSSAQSRVDFDGLIEQALLGKLRRHHDPRLLDGLSAG
jgi:transposase